jgi:PAT family beta-lactamase induction signal transducer AmpG
MALPNLLVSRRGRLVAFFALYVTEGIPLGFTATAIATQMRRQGLGPAEIGGFVASLYLPWAFKWAIGPFVDVLSSDRWGRRRMWIVLAQVMMTATLLAALPINFTTQLQLFTVLIFIHNVFGATQDVAIDALAVSVLSEQERGVANGLMFGGAYLGQALGGAGVLFLAPVIGFNTTFLAVAGSILFVTVFVALPLRENPERRAPRGGTVLQSTLSEIADFLRQSIRAVLGSRGAFVGLLFALLPAGAYALGLALQSNLAVELGLDDTRIGFLNLWSTLLSAAGCIVGGWLSDRFGRRPMLALYIVATALPTLGLAMVMQRAGWIMPVDPGVGTHARAGSGLIVAFWAATLVYSVFQGLMYGTRTALFMDVTTVRVAATQFTAYMALLNLVISYSATWQGWSVERWGYPLTLTLDSLLGLVSLTLLPLMSARAAPVPVAADAPAS